MAKTTPNAAAIRELLESYNDLNPSIIQQLHQEPSALEFMRFVASNRPFVVRSATTASKAVATWTAEHLISVLGDSPVNVAITPEGNADAVLKREDGSLAFVKPFERKEPFSQFLDDVMSQQQSLDHDPAPRQAGKPVRYGQTQNDNLRGEYERLLADVPASVPFARIALAKEPDAVNLWLGNSLSVTSLHKDNYENIYVQITGQKHFVLLPPVAAPCVGERLLPAETYSLKHVEPSRDIHRDDLVATRDDPPELVPVATWDPDTPTAMATPFSPLASPMRVTLDPGDMLYLPALWYHKVAQSCGDGQDFCCAVNYWYDMEFGGGQWATQGFVRRVGNETNAELERGGA